MVDQSIVDAFQMMWGPFPEPVMLIHKDRTILAVNDFARNLGVSDGIKCYLLNPEAGGKVCPDCMANAAVSNGETIRRDGDKNGVNVMGYWMPLKETPEVYIHFGVNQAAAMGLAAKN